MQNKLLLLHYESSAQKKYQTHLRVQNYAKGKKLGVHLLPFLGLYEGVEWTGKQYLKFLNWDVSSYFKHPIKNTFGWIKQNQPTLRIFFLYNWQEYWIEDMFPRFCAIYSQNVNAEEMESECLKSIWHIKLVKPKKKQYITIIIQFVKHRQFAILVPTLRYQQELFIRHNHKL